MNVVVWDIQNGVRPLELPRSDSVTPQNVTALEFSPDGKLLATGTQHGTIRVWDLARGNLVSEIAAHPGPIAALAYSPDGTRLASLGGNDHTVKAWHTADRQQTGSWWHGGRASEIAFSPDGRILAGTGDDNNVARWDLTTGTALPDGMHGAEAVEYSPDGRTIATVNAEGNLAIWDNATQTRRATNEIGRRIHDVSYTPDGRYVASSDSNGAIRLTDVVRSTTVVEFPTGEAKGLHTVRIGANGVIAAAGDNAVLLWRSTELPYIGGEVSNDVTFGPDQRTILAAGWYHTFVSWDVTKPTQPAVEIPGSDRDPASQQVFSPDGTRMAVTTRDNRALVYDVTTRARVAELGTPSGDVPEMAFSRDGRSLAIGRTVWDIDRRRLLAELPASAGHALAFSPDGRNLASTDGDKTAIWDTVTGAVVTRVPHAVRAISFSPDGNMLTTAGTDGVVKIWDVHSGHHIADLTDPLRRLREASFSPDGKRLATISEADPDIILWNTETWSVWAVLHGHSLPVTAATWSADSAFLVSAGNDRSIVTWYTTTDLATRHICGTGVVQC